MQTLHTILPSLAFSRPATYAAIFSLSLQRAFAQVLGAALAIAIAETPDGRMQIGALAFGEWDGERHARWVCCEARAEASGEADPAGPRFSDEVSRPLPRLPNPEHALRALLSNRRKNCTTGVFALERLSLPHLSGVT